MVGHRTPKSPSNGSMSEEGHSIGQALPTREVTPSERLQLTDASSSVPSQFFNTTASMSVTATESIPPSLRMFAETKAVGGTSTAPPPALEEKGEERLVLRS